MPRANRPIKQIDGEGKVLRRFKDATDASTKLGVAKSTIYQMLRGELCKKKTYRLEYDDDLPGSQYDGATATTRNFKELRGYHAAFNKTTAMERICIMCNKAFLSHHKGNRICAKCNYNIETEFHAVEYKYNATHWRGKSGMRNSDQHA